MLGRHTSTWDPMQVLVINQLERGDSEGAGWEKMDRPTGSLSGCTEAVSQRFGATQWGMTNGTGSNDKAVIQRRLSTWRGHEKIIYKFSSLIMN